MWKWSTSPRRKRRVTLGVGLGLVTAILVTFSSYHSATVQLSVSNHLAYPVFMTFIVNGMQVYNQTMYPGASWHSTLTLNWVGLINPWSCESFPVVGHTNTGNPSENGQAMACSGQPSSVAFSVG